MRTNSVENRLIQNIDRPSDDEVTKRGILSEELVINSTNTNLPGFRARLSTSSEDSGVRDIGSHPTIDVVVYYKNRPAMAVQITTAQDMKTQRKKMNEVLQNPLVRLEEMKPQDTAIPKVLVHIPREMVESYSQNPELSKSPEVMLKTLDGYIKSLQVVLMRTKHPQEQMAIKELLEEFTGQQKKLLH